MSIPVRQRRVNAAVQAMSNMTPPDYVDLFTATAAQIRRASPEYWARTAIERAAGGGGQLIWRGLLRLRLASSRAPDLVGGWRIGERADRWIRLEAASSSLTAHIAIAADDGELSMATFLRYDRPFGAILWRPLSAIHRGLMPGLLRSAVTLERAGARPSIAAT
jgi:hypothetical protein